MHIQDAPRQALVLDDEYLIAVELESILSAAGYQVLSAVTVAEARRFVRSLTVHVAVLDFRMDSEARDLAHDLLAAGVPIVFCTGSLVEEVQAVFPGASVVSKPFEASTVLQAVAVALSASVVPD